MAASIQSPSPTAQPSATSPKPPPTEKGPKGNPKKQRRKGPNYNAIHAKPLPLEVHPLPAFIPHNPISVVRIAITLLSHSFWPPKSHSTIHQAYFSPETQSIHVTNPKSIRALWEQGFWGAGSLSRSEPRWLDQEKRKRGIEAAATSEEFTRGRREERRQFKLERAKAQREAIEQQLREEGKLDAEADLDELVQNGSVTESPRGTLYPADTATPLGNIATSNGISVVDEVNEAVANEMPDFEPDLKDQEHLQLTFEEAFFLSYGLGALEIYLDDTRLGPSHLLRICSTNSEFANEGKLTSKVPLSNINHEPISPDNPFLLKYIVFHHVRSLGWVVRPGIKFACDYLLYLRGPAFHHAEFAIMIVPSYSHPYWSETAERTAACKEKEKKDWWWLHRLNRVQTQVHKTLMLVYVEVPPPWNEGHKERLDIGHVLKQYTVREFIWKRWSPNRNRD